MVTTSSLLSLAFTFIRHVILMSTGEGCPEAEIYKTASLHMATFLSHITTLQMVTNTLEKRNLQEFSMFIDCTTILASFGKGSCIDGITNEKPNSYCDYPSFEAYDLYGSGDLKMNKTRSDETSKYPRHYDHDVMSKWFPDLRFPFFDKAGNGLV